MECIVGSSDIYFVTTEPMYYDGRPFLLVHDPEVRDKAWSVVALRYPEGGQKVRIVTLGAKDVLCDYPNVPINCEPESKEYVEKYRERALKDLWLPSHPDACPTCHGKDFLPGSVPCPNESWCQAIYPTKRAAHVCGLKKGHEGYHKSGDGFDWC